METIKTKNDLASSLMAAKSATDDRKQVLELRSLLDRMFTLDPSSGSPCETRWLTLL